MEIRPGVWVLPGSKVLNPGARLQIVRPASGLLRGPGRAHTNVLVAVPRGGYPAARPAAVGPPMPDFLFETPASLACAYGLVTEPNGTKPGCDPNVVTVNPTGGTRAIAVVDAYDDSAYAASDLAQFDTQFGIAAANFTVIFGTGNPALGCKNGPQPGPAHPSGWDIEESLDIEYAHAMAPSAHLYLVEAASSSNTDLLNAEKVAVACVQAAGGGQISNSWGVAEFSGETSLDSAFTGTNVVFFASTGDDTYPIWPAESPNVVGVGGTTMSRDPNSGAFLGQSTWYPNPDQFANDDVLEGTGAGDSTIEARPAFQNGVASIVGAHRAIPDLVADADPGTGVWVYSTTGFSGWSPVGGTSLSSPLVAGIFNRNGNFFASTNAALTELYSLGTRTPPAIGNYLSKMDSGLCGNVIPSPPATYITFGGEIDPQHDEAVGGVTYNRCGGWGSPNSPRQLGH